jgi:hypothetical protein
MKTLHPQAPNQREESDRAAILVMKRMLVTNCDVIKTNVEACQMKILQYYFMIRYKNDILYYKTDDVLFGQKWSTFTRAIPHTDLQTEVKNDVFCVIVNCLL